MAINKIDEVVIAPSLKAIIDAKADTTYVDNIHTNIENEVSSIVSNMDWRQAVITYNDIITTYPSPQDGWTVNVEDTDWTYRYDGTSKTWIPISANSIPIVSETVDGKMSKEDKTKLDGVQANAQVNPTATDILNSLKTVDGSGSGLDANLLDGQASSYYLNYSNFSNVPDVYTKTEINQQMNGKASTNVTDSISSTIGSATLQTTAQTLKEAINEVRNSTIIGGSVANADTVDNKHASDFGQLEVLNTWTQQNNFNSIEIDGNLYFKPTSDNTDSIYITKNNVATDISSLDLVIGDNGTGNVISVPSSGGTDYVSIKSSNLGIHHLFGTDGTYKASSTIQGTQLNSTVATGTAPLTVNSITSVNNLNVDMLDGKHLSDINTEIQNNIQVSSSQPTNQQNNGLWFEITE